MLDEELGRLSARSQQGSPSLEVVEYADPGQGAARCWARSYAGFRAQLLLAFSPGSPGSGLAAPCRRRGEEGRQCWRGALGLVAGGRRGVVLGPAVTRNLGGDEDEILGGDERETLGGEVGRQVSSEEILGARWAATRWARRSRVRGGRRRTGRGEAGREVGDDALGEAIPIFFEFQLIDWKGYCCPLPFFWGCRKFSSAPYKSERRETFPSMTRCLR